MTQLTLIEQNELQQHEAAIERGLKTFVEVGTALTAIRDGRLYRPNYCNFEDYCQGRWGMSRPRAYQLIDAAKVNHNLSTVVDKLPSTERQARELARLEPEEQREIWQELVGRDSAETITAEEIRKAVHVSHNSGNNEWYTPPEYIEAARRVMGGIDLDPASSGMANTIVGASRFYTQEDDGLMHDWAGRVWMNPPYEAGLIRAFADKLAVHVRRREVNEACVLVNNATETGWFRVMLDVASCVCFIRGRVKFIDSVGNPSGAPLQGQALLYIGLNVGDFTQAFSGFGTVLYAGCDS